MQDRQSGRAEPARDRPFASQKPVPAARARFRRQRDVRAPGPRPAWRVDPEPPSRRNSRRAGPQGVAVPRVPQENVSLYGLAQSTRQSARLPSSAKHRSVSVIATRLVPFRCGANSSLNAAVSVAAGVPRRSSFRSDARGGGETPELSGGTGDAAEPHTRARGAAAASTKSNFHIRGTRRGAAKRLNKFQN